MTLTFLSCVNLKQTNEYLMKKILPLILLSSCLSSCLSSAFASNNFSDQEDKKGKTSTAKKRKASSATLGKKSHPTKKARIQQQSCGNLEFYDRDKAFYEFTNFSAHTVAYEGHSFSVSE